MCTYRISFIFYCQPGHESFGTLDFRASDCRWGRIHERMLFILLCSHLCVQLQAMHEQDPRAATGLNHQGGGVSGTCDLSLLHYAKHGIAITEVHKHCLLRVQARAMPPPAPAVASLLDRPSRPSRLCIILSPHRLWGTPATFNSHPMFATLGRCLWCCGINAYIRSIKCLLQVQATAMTPLALALVSP